MHFQLRFFLKLSAFPVLVLGILSIAPPSTFLTSEFLIGTKVERQLMTLRSQAQSIAVEEGFSPAPLDEAIQAILEDNRQIIDSARDRQSAIPIRMFVTVLIIVLVVALLITLLRSWKADVTRLSRNLNSRSPTDP